MKVKIRGSRSYSIPRLCACCLRPTKFEEEISAVDPFEGGVNGAYNVRVINSLCFPKCFKCKIHAKFAGWWIYLLCFAPLAFLFYLITDVFSVSLKKIGNIIAFVIVFGLPGTVVEFYKEKIWPKKHPEHANIKDVVKMKIKDSYEGFKIIEILFQNNDYGKLFAETNKEIIISVE